jgi:putative Holliday junction resolvase
MPPLTLAELRAALPRSARLIGLDPGAKVIGVALSDVTLTLASPYGSLKRGRLAAAAAEVAAIARKEGAGGLVVGLPLGMDGSFGPAAQAAKDWGRALAEAAGLPVAFWDERLSSAAVNRAMIEADLSRAKRAERVDAAAAAYMLQAALDATRGE